MPFHKEYDFAKALNFLDLMPMLMGNSVSHTVYMYASQMFY